MEQPVERLLAPLVAGRRANRQRPGAAPLAVPVDRPSLPGGGEQHDAAAAPAAGERRVPRATIPGGFEAEQDGPQGIEKRRLASLVLAEHHRQAGLELPSDIRETPESADVEALDPHQRSSSAPTRRSSPSDSASSSKGPTSASASGVTSRRYLRPRGAASNRACTDSRRMPCQRSNSSGS